MPDQGNPPRHENERQQVNPTENQELEQAYEALAQKNRELETLDRIVESINRELALEDVMKALLDQGLELLPQAERGAFMILDHADDRFEVVASSGRQKDLVMGISLTVEEAVRRYTHDAEELGEGIYLARDPGARAGTEKLRHLPHPEALLSIAVTLGEEVEGFLSFAIITPIEELARLDSSNLKRYRQHAISALDKAELIARCRRNTLRSKKRTSSFCALRPSWSGAPPI